MEYETVLVVNGTLDDTTIEAEINKAESFIKSRGEIKGADRWGKRRLAYSIRKKTHGYYTLFTYTGDGALVRDMERDFRMNENVLRYLTVKADRK